MASEEPVDTETSNPADARQLKASAARSSEYFSGDELRELQEIDQLDLDEREALEEICRMRDELVEELHARHRDGLPSDEKQRAVNAAAESLARPVLEFVTGAVASGIIGSAAFEILKRQLRHARFWLKSGDKKWQRLFAQELARRAVAAKLQTKTILQIKDCRRFGDQWSIVLEADGSTYRVLIPVEDPSHVTVSVDLHEHAQHRHTEQPRRRTRRRPRS
jgi:hypothetical protein